MPPRKAAKRAAPKRPKAFRPPFAEDTLFTLPAIGDAINVDADALRKWFAPGPQGGGLVLALGHDEPAGSGGRTHRLHWRTAVALMLANRLNAFGLRLRGGEAAMCAAQVFKHGLAFEHLFIDARPLIAIVPRGDNIAVALVRRDALAGYVEAVITAEDGFESIGTLLVDPASFGVLLKRLAEGGKA